MWIEFHYFISRALFFSACNVLYLNSMDMESLTGPEAVSKAIKDSLLNVPKTTVVHFKVSSQGITLTDSKRKYVTPQIK